MYLTECPAWVAPLRTGGKAADAFTPAASPSTTPSLHLRAGSIDRSARQITVEVVAAAVGVVGALVQEGVAVVHPAGYS